MDILQELITTDPTEGILATATGIPPHVEMAVKLEEINSSLTSFMKLTQNQSERVMGAIDEAFENKAIESGKVTGHKLKEILLEFKKSTLEVVSQKMTEMIKEASSGREGGILQQTPTAVVGLGLKDKKTFSSTTVDGIPYQKTLSFPK